MTGIKTNEQYFKMLFNLKAEDNDNKKIVKGVISDETLDRDREILRAKGCDVNNYLKNPIVLFNHMFNKPIGKCIDIQVNDDKVVATIEFLENDEDAEKIYNAIKQGVLNAFSVGFIPKKIYFKDEIDKMKEEDGEFVNRHMEDLIKTRAVIWEWELYEFSVVSVPANPNALITAKSLGLELAFPTGKCFGNKFCDIAITEKELKALEEKGVIPYSAHGKLPVRNSTKWDKQKAINSLKKWASDDCSGEWEKVNLAKFRLGFGYVDDTAPDKITSYKYPHHWGDCEKGLMVDRKGVKVGMLFCLARKGNLTEEEFKKLYNHLAKHYINDLEETPPEWKEKAITFEDLLKMNKEEFELAFELGLVHADDVKDYIGRLQKQIEMLNDEKEKASQKDDDIIVVKDDEGNVLFTFKKD